LTIKHASKDERNAGQRHRPAQLDRNDDEMDMPSSSNDSRESQLSLSIFLFFFFFKKKGDRESDII
jgi:hypothetical protein